MTPIVSLWLPILVSSVLVFVASSLIHMKSPWHKSDYQRLADEEGVLDALRGFSIPPGEYLAPRPTQASDMSSPEFIAKRERGPVILLNMIPPGPPAMGSQLGGWFVYIVVVSICAACVAGSILPAGETDMHPIFHYVAFVSLIGYALALWQISIWFHRKWSTTMKATVDGAIYALITGLVFVWLWPHV